MRSSTKKNLEEAFGGESKAAMKYSIYSEIAEKNGFPNVSKLFRAISYAETVHATNHYRNLGMIKSTSENLEDAIEGEHYEVNEMYPVFNQVAKFQNEKGAELSTEYALEAEKIHESLYKNALENINKKKDIDSADVFICPVCGYTVVGKAPEKCPVCGTAGSKFKKF
ncbi:MAG: rubrerythrin family protein [Candidatus Thermoplasmatota archaeon]|jgi:rubrerythrin|nr:rubrerythrin family protein [Candidatus Thermoplasmatota archaeon]